MSVIIKDMELPKTCSQCEIWSKCWDERPFWFERLECCPLTEKADRKTEPSVSEKSTGSEKPNNCEDWQDWKDRMWAEAVVTEPQTIAEDINRRVEMGKKEWNARHIEYEPQTETRTETQTETQNSNLTFEKRTMRDCYNCKRYENDCECRECKYEPKDEPTISKMEQVDKDINVRSKERSSEK